MIRKTMIGLSLFALMTGSALAATPTSKHVSKPRTVAAAPAGDMKEPAKADAPKADAPKADAPKTDAPKSVACTNPRPQACTMEYAPVCATRDTGVRCITTPCPSSEQVTKSSSCNACSDTKVISYVKGECPAK